MSKPASPVAASPQDAPGTQAEPGAEWTGDIEVDTAEADSTYAESLAVTDTTSLKSSLLQFKWENGRRYHAEQEGKYWAPNDDKQQEVEDLVHTMNRIILDDKLYLAPIAKDPHHVVDLGCGTGIWAIDFADEHPSAEVVGVDISPIQPQLVPPNCRFEVDDINKEWTFKDDFFDFIHVRFLTGCVPDWVEFHKKSLKHLKPGGWVEQYEISAIPRSDDGTLKEESALYRWAGLFKRIGEITGQTFLAPEVCRDAIEAAGFANVHERILKVPIGKWPKNKTLKHWGVWNRQFLLDGIEGFAIRSMTSLLGWSVEETQLYLVDVRKDLLDPNIHSYIEIRVAYGQKPEASS